MQYYTVIVALLATLAVAAPHPSMSDCKAARLAAKADVAPAVAARAVEHMEDKRAPEPILPVDPDDQSCSSC